MDQSDLLKKRIQNLEKRREMLKDMNILASPATPNPEKKKRKRRAPIVVDESQRRKSRRLHGLQPEIVDTETIGENPLTATELEEPKVRVVREFKESYDTADLTGITFPIHVDGTYHGSVDPVVAKRYGIPVEGESPATEEPATEMEENPSAKPKRRSSGTSTAKEKSRKCLRSNPNTYFYRHVEPNVQQWTGDWTHEEIRLFFLTAQQFGCGDKWGLFSTYIPHRVGYQCSNFYRQYALPKGLVIDPHYTITSSGEAV
ncbi:hypothetical protein WA588_004108, partial [Blastocystis sp. NMH]